MTVVHHHLLSTNTWGNIPSIFVQNTHIRALRSVSSPANRNQSEYFNTTTIQCSTPLLTFMQRQRPLRVWQQVSGERLSMWCGAFGWALMFPCCCLGGRQMGRRHETLSWPDICWLGLDESTTPLLLLLKRRFTLGAVLGLALTVWAAYVTLWVLVRSSKTASKDIWSPCLINILPESGVYVEFNQENLCPSVLV